MEPQHLENSGDENAEKINESIDVDEAASTSKEILNEEIETTENYEGVSQNLGKEINRLHMKKDLKDYDIKDLIKDAINVTYVSCNFCLQAKMMFISSKQLALHILEKHGFYPIYYSFRTKRKKRKNINDVLCLPRIFYKRWVNNQLIIKMLPNVKKSTEEFEQFVKKSVKELEGCYTNYEIARIKKYKGDFNLVMSILKCFQCSFETDNYKLLILHVLNLHEENYFPCLLCKSSFHTYPEFSFHLCNGKPILNEDPKFRCCFCSDNIFQSKLKFLVHIRTVHGRCDICLKPITKQHKLFKHIIRHKQGHRCFKCKTSYTSSDDLKHHMFWKHGSESFHCKKCLEKKWRFAYHFCMPPKYFKCEECGLKFRRPVSLKVHKRLHSGHLPHSCAKCADRFISKKLALRHQNLDHQNAPTNKSKEMFTDREVSTLDSEVTSNIISICKERNDIDNENASTSVTDSVEKIGEKSQVSNEPHSQCEIIIRESDLETEESSSDEDFFDDQPSSFSNYSSKAEKLTVLSEICSSSAVNAESDKSPSQYLVSSIFESQGKATTVV